LPCLLTSFYLDALLLKKGLVRSLHKKLYPLQLLYVGDPLSLKLMMLLMKGMLFLLPFYKQKLVEAVLYQVHKKYLQLLLEKRPSHLLEPPPGMKQAY
jgi:hypothetical protein